MMGSLYADVYRPPTQEEIREATAQRNRRMYANPRPATLVANTSEITIKPQATNAARAVALARYDELITEGVAPRVARLRVEAEQGVKERTLLGWIQDRDKRGKE